jgi:para-nitrobenzyl esterase
MKRSLHLAALAIAAAPIIAAPAMAADTTATASAAKPAFTTADTDLGTLLDNPATKAVLSKYIAPMISNPQIDMARSMTLRQLQPYAGDQLTDDALAKIDAGLAQVPAAK